MSMKICQTLLIEAPADGQLHEFSITNPESSPIYIHKIIGCRIKNTNCGQDSNAWVCLPRQGDRYITQHFNPSGGGGATQVQTDYPRPFKIEVDEEIEVGIVGTGNGGNMYYGTLIFYTLEP